MEENKKQEFNNNQNQSSPQAAETNQNQQSPSQPTLIIDNQSSQGQPQKIDDFGQNKAILENERPSYSGNGSNQNKNLNFGSNRGKINQVIRILVILAIVFGAIWYFNREQTIIETGEEDNGVSIIIDDQPEQGEVRIIDNDQATPGQPVPVEGEILITAYYSNTRQDPEMINCDQVYPLIRTTEKKYDEEVVNTLRGLLTPLSEAEKVQGWISSIPENTFLKEVRISEGVVRANFTSSLGTVAGSCAVQAVRAQIEQTLLRFPYIEAVEICVEGNCNQDEILQP